MNLKHTILSTFNTTISTSNELTIKFKIIFINVIVVGQIFWYTIKLVSTIQRFYYFTNLGNVCIPTFITTYNYILRGIK